MYAQRTLGDSAGRQDGLYGAAGLSSLPNGTIPVAAPTDDSAQVHSGSGLENPNLQDPAPVEGTRLEATMQQAGEQFLQRATEPEYHVTPDRSAGVIDDSATALVPSAPVVAQAENRTPTTPTSSTLRVQEFYSAETTHPQNEDGNVRWFTRISEFLRTTVHRGAAGMDRVLDNLRVPSLPQQRTVQELQVRTSVMGTPLNISPPEELPQPRPLPPVPSTWAAARPAEPPLFSTAQVEQMRQAQREHPWIYGPVVQGQQSEPESERSSRLQAEVQRQLEEYSLRYQEQVQSLQQEVEKLRSERSYWMGRSSDSRGVLEGPPADAGVIPRLLPQAPLPIPHPVPQGSTVPQGNPQPTTHEGYPERVMDADVQQGNPGLVQANANVPPDAKEPRVPTEPPEPTVPQVAPFGRQGLTECQGSSQGLRHGDPASLREVPGGLSVYPDPVPQGSTVPRGNPQTTHEGPFLYGQARGQESGPFYADGQARGQESGNLKSDLGETTKAEGQQTAQQWLGNATTQDPMALLAGGMAQLQAVMLKQMVNDTEKEKTGASSPETVKPGTSTLPTLPPVDPRTSAIDIMDWLEMITTPMQDLSDGSAEWWAKVRTAAMESYYKWATASPVEKLVIQPPRIEELETGRWSRVNSRSASMVLLALHASVRLEMVQRRSTGSTCSLIFRLLTLYQPGGQQEKVHMLQSLQQPEAAASPQQAVESLRAWARWLRRCRELNVTAPDPSLLARGLSTITKSVIERDSEVSFRTSWVRSTLLVDTTPSYDSVEKYYHHLLAECESLAVASSTMTSSQPTPTPAQKPEPKMKPMRTETVPVPPPPPRTTSQDRSSGEEGDRASKANTLCKFFGKTYKGCARGSKCPFKHTWEGNEKEKSGRVEERGTLPRSVQQRRLRLSHKEPRSLLLQSRPGTPRQLHLLPPKQLQQTRR